VPGGQPWPWSVRAGGAPSPACPRGGPTHQSSPDGRGLGFFTPLKGGWLQSTTGNSPAPGCGRLVAAPAARSRLQRRWRVAPGQRRAAPCMSLRLLALPSSWPRLPPAWRGGLFLALWCALSAVVVRVVVWMGCAPSLCNSVVVRAVVRKRGCTAQAPESCGLKWATVLNAVKKTNL